MIVTLLIASLAVVLRIIRQAGRKRMRSTRSHHAGCMYPSPIRAIRNNPARGRPSDTPHEKRMGHTRNSHLTGEFPSFLSA